jgi:hypothetical protein
LARIEGSQLAADAAYVAGTFHIDPVTAVGGTSGDELFDTQFRVAAANVWHQMTGAPAGG